MFVFYSIKNQNKVNKIEPVNKDKKYRNRKRSLPIKKIISHGQDKNFNEKLRIKKKNTRKEWLEFFDWILKSICYSKIWLNFSLIKI